MKPQRVRLLRNQLPPANTVYVGRPTKWGNPVYVTVAGSRAEAVRLYEQHLQLHPELVQQAKAELRGKNLACWCPLDGGPCHAEVLLRIANEE